MVLVEDLSAKGREGPPPLPPALQPRGAALRRPRGGCRQKPPPGRSSRFGAGGSGRSPAAAWRLAEGGAAAGLPCSLARSLSPRPSIRRAEASKDETGGGEGIPVLQNRPSEQDGERGQFPRQACHLKSKIPGFVQTIAPEGSLVFHEKAWNADPCCRMVVTNEYMKDDFFIKIETWHKPDLGSSENVHKLDPETWENVEVAHIDVADRNQVEPGLRNPGEVRGTSAANEE